MVDPIQSFRIIPQNLSAQIRRQIVALDKTTNFFDETLESEGVREIRRKDDMIGAEELRNPGRDFSAASQPT